jgi:hypothetical protein
MLTVDQVESGEYSVNDVADLLMRVQIATKALCFVADELNRSGLTDSRVRDAHSVALNTWWRMQHDHDCNVEKLDDNTYRCECDLLDASTDAAQEGQL